MIKTVVPASHNGLTTYGAAAPTPTPDCFAGFIGSGCTLDPTKWKDWVGVKGAGQVVDDTGQSILWTSRSLKDFAESSDKVALLIPFIVLILALGLAIGWSKGHRYFA